MHMSGGGGGHGGGMGHGGGGHHGGHHGGHSGGGEGGGGGLSIGHILGLTHGHAGGLFGHLAHMLGQHHGAVHHHHAGGGEPDQSPSWNMAMQADKVGLGGKLLRYKFRFTPAVGFFFLFIGLTFWLGVIYQLRHHEPTEHFSDLAKQLYGQQLPTTRVGGQTLPSVTVNDLSGAPQSQSMPIAPAMTQGYMGTASTQATPQYAPASYPGAAQVPQQYAPANYPGAAQVPQQYAPASYPGAAQAISCRVYSIPGRVPVQGYSPYRAGNPQMYPAATAPGAYPMAQGYPPPQRMRVFAAH